MLPKTMAAAIAFGNLHAQFVRCGKENCRCARGQLHGPYHYLFWREAGQLRKVYVRRGAVAEVAAACEISKQLRDSSREAAAAAGPAPDLLGGLLETAELIDEFLGSK